MGEWVDGCAGAAGGYDGGADIGIGKFYGAVVVGSAGRRNAGLTC